MINCKGVKKQVRCAVLCVACDLPAARKTCGFLYVADALIALLDLDVWIILAFTSKTGHKKLKGSSTCGFKLADIFLAC